MPSKLITAFIVEIKQEMARVSDSAMMRPALDVPGEMARRAGLYQGLAASLAILDGVLSDEAKNDDNT